jgi:hypothetical protein
MKDLAVVINASLMASIVAIAARASIYDVLSPDMSWVDVAIFPDDTHVYFVVLSPE